MAQRNSKVKKYRKPLNLNIGMIIFGVIFIYVVICIILYFQTGRIVRYEVKEGSLTTDNTYRGIALRSETLMTVGAAGYVNYYAREGERVAKNDLVYVVDETGRLNEELEAMNLGENTLSDRELAEFRNEIVDFAHGFDRTNYSAAYDFKYTLKNTVLKLANVNMLASVGSLNGGSGNNIIYSYAPGTGIVAYWTDGYETLSADAVSESVFDEKNYTKTQLMGNELRAAGDVAYKLVTDENWSIVIPVEASRGAQLQEEGYIKVRFLKNQYEAWGKAQLVVGSDGNNFLQLSFTNSMISFINDRFLDVELIVEDETGLKIPVSSIVQKEFFLIPERFITIGSENGGNTVLRQYYDAETNAFTTEALEIEVYNFDAEAGEYYVDSSWLNAGDILCKKEGQETYTVGKRATLIGVYNMNKGYADFKQINILYQNDEYAIVNSNTRYGLSVYDYIVLDASSVSDDQFINQ